MPTLRQLSYLTALADERHFRRAAERVHVTQPTLSVQLAVLEKTLGVKLVDRSGKSVALTPIGREVADRARRILEEVRGIRALAASAQHGLAGTVRLGVPPTLGPYLLPHVVPALHRRFPELKLHVREGMPRDLLARLQEGAFDFLLSPLPAGAGVEVAPLFSEPLMVAAAPDHPLAAKENVVRKDLQGENLLALEPGHHLHEQVRSLCDAFGATLLSDYEGTSLDTLRQMAGMGVGLAVLPALYVHSEIAGRGEVAVLNLTDKSLHRSIGMIWPARAHGRPQFQEIAALIREIAGERFKDLTIQG